MSDAVVDASSGALGSLLALGVTYPLKTISLQQSITAGSGSGAAALSVLGIIQRYGLSGLFVGFGTSAVESTASSGVYFYLYSLLRDAAVKHEAGRRKAAQQQQQQQQGQAAAATSQAEEAPAAGAAAASSKSERVSVLASLLVATVAGLGNQAATLPLSTIVTRMQAQHRQRLDKRSSEGAAAADALPPVTAWTAAADIWSHDGLAGFWTGFTPSLVLLANPAIQFMLYEQLLALLQKWKRRRLQRKQQQQQQQQHHKAAATVCSANGCHAGENGHSGDVDASKKQQQAAAAAEASAPVKLSAGEVFLASALAKIGATVATYPMIVVKSRLQASNRYSGPWHAVSSIAATEGPGGFFRGLKAKILQTTLNAALMLMLKEQIYLLVKASLKPAGPLAGTSGRPGARSWTPASELRGRLQMLALVSK